MTDVLPRGVQHIQAAVVLFASQAAATVEDAEGTGPPDRALRDRLQGDLDTQNTAMWVSFALGAALSGGGVYLLLDAPEAAVAGVGPGVVWGRF